LDKSIPKNNDEGRAIYGNLENKINTLYWPVENSIPKNNDRSRLFKHRPLTFCNFPSASLEENINHHLSCSCA
jgi:hypothetical protein